MITSKKELIFYIKADRMMNIGSFNLSKLQIFKKLMGGYKVLKYLECLRKLEYYDYKVKYCSSHRCVLLFKILYKKYNLLHSKLGCKLGFTIYPNVLGYAVFIPHWGTIVIGPGNTVVNYALFHTSTCIPKGKSNIGNFLKMSTGSVVGGNSITLGNGITVAANAVITKDFLTNNVLLTGIPAINKAERNNWIYYDGPTFIFRYEAIERLKREIGLS